MAGAEAEAVRGDPAGRGLQLGGSDLHGKAGMTRSLREGSYMWTRPEGAENWRDQAGWEGQSGTHGKAVRGDQAGRGGHLGVTRLAGEGI